MNTARAFSPFDVLKKCQQYKKKKQFFSLKKQGKNFKGVFYFKLHSPYSSRISVFIPDIGRQLTLKEKYGLKS